MEYLLYTSSYKEPKAFTTYLKGKYIYSTNPYDEPSTKDKEALLPACQLITTAKATQLVTAVNILLYMGH